MEQAIVDDDARPDRRHRIFGRQLLRFILRPHAMTAGPDPSGSMARIHTNQGYDDVDRVSRHGRVDRLILEEKWVITVNVLVLCARKSCDSTKASQNALGTKRILH